MGEAKARLLEYGHRPRGPKAAIRRDPVTYATVAFFAGVILSRFRPGPLVPIAAVATRPMIKRVLPIVGRIAAAKFASHMQTKAAKAQHAAAAAAGGPQHRPYQAQPPFSAPSGGVGGMGGAGGVGGSARGSAPGPSRSARGEWAIGPQRGVIPPQARSRPPQGRPD